MHIIHTLSFPLLHDGLGAIRVPEQRRLLLNTISPNSYGLAQRDAKTREALQRSDALILDGVYFGLAPLLLQGVKVRRITGWDAFMHFAGWAGKEKGRLFLLGATTATLQQMQERLKREFPGAAVDYYAPPFRDVFTPEDNEAMHAAINRFGPDILLIGMTAPKQEQWAYFNKAQVNAKVICTVGNVFDWYAGNSKRPSRFWQRLGLEWLVRIFYRPEIFRRNTANQLLFFRDLLLLLIKVKKPGG